MGKYIYENGIMKLDPNYLAQNQTKPSTATPGSLAIVSSTKEIMDANQSGVQIPLAPSTVETMRMIEDDPEFLNKFGNLNIKGEDIVDGLTSVFEKHEMPIGLTNKVLMTTEYDGLNFIMDNSGSMSQNSDVLVGEASEFIKHKLPQNRRNNPYAKLTRWEEAEDRLHVILDMLAYVPVGTITITFFNNHNNLILDHRNKTPEQFAKEAHQKIDEAFHERPTGGTPIFNKLVQPLNDQTKTLHYLFTDGEPDGGLTEKGKIKKLVKERNAALHPINFISCTDNDHEVEWLQELDDDAGFVAMIDDFNTEKNRALKIQGPGFPYTRGMWLLCQLVKCINPDDLDMITEKIPFTKFTLDNILGRITTPQEYNYYFTNNPNSAKFQAYYNRFASESALAKNIINQPQTYAPSAPPMYPNVQPPYNPQYPQQPSVYMNQQSGYTPGMWQGQTPNQPTQNNNNQPTYQPNPYRKY